MQLSEKYFRNPVKSGRLEERVTSSDRDRSVLLNEEKPSHFLQRANAWDVELLKFYRGNRKPLFAYCRDGI